MLLFEPKAGHAMSSLSTAMKWLPSPYDTLMRHLLIELQVLDILPPLVVPFGLQLGQLTPLLLLSQVTQLRLHSDDMTGWRPTLNNWHGVQICSRHTQCRALGVGRAGLHWGGIRDST